MTPAMAARARHVLCLLGIFSLVACHRNNGSSNEQAASDRGQLCKDGGATLSAANECVCPATARWNGLKCEPLAPRAVADADGSIAKDGSHESGDIQIAKETPTPTVEPPPVKAEAAGTTTAIDPGFRQLCRVAGGHFVPLAQYCLCPRGEVLVGQHCRQLSGHVTDDTCREAYHPGKWDAGQCDCSEHLVFAPSRGGCVPPVRNDEVVLRRECESSLSRGHWRTATHRCDCPNRRVWKDELCQSRQDLSSSEICESAENSGRWDAARKLCQCGQGRLWISQECRLPAEVSIPDACNSEQGGGQWNPTLVRCICPRLATWNEQTLHCEG